MGNGESDLAPIPHSPFPVVIVTLSGAVVSHHLDRCRRHSPASRSLMSLPRPTIVASLAPLLLGSVLGSVLGACYAPLTLAKSDAPVVLARQQLAAPNPAERGTFTV